MKILVVDDEAHIRELMRLTLEAAGYSVDEAASGEEALTRFGAGGGEYAVVLLDQKMPGIDGLETLRRIIVRAPDARVVMVTAFASIELAVDAMKAGATDFLRKPMTPETLRGAVSAALAGAAPVHPAGRRVPVDLGQPHIQALTLNGFRLVRTTEPSLARGEHAFRVTHFPDAAEVVVTVLIDPEAVARVERLSRRRLEPSGAFWQDQAQRSLAAYLWTEGRFPDGGRLTVNDVSREDLELAAAWALD